MKVIIVIVAMTLGSWCGAWEFKDNPDRFPSVGLNYGYQSIKGTLDSSVPGTSFHSNDINTNVAILNLDLRLPFSDWFTFYFGLSGLGQKSSYDGVYSGGSTVAQTSTSSLSGGGFNIGARYYFH